MGDRVASRRPVRTGTPGTGLELQQAAGIRSIRTENMDKMVLKTDFLSSKETSVLKRQGGEDAKKPHINLYKDQREN